MATQVGILEFEGKLGEVIAYNRKGKRCVRRMPKHVRRSMATMLSATDFGTASKAGKLLRRIFRQELDIRQDGNLTNRLNQELLKVLYAGSNERGNRYFQHEELALLTGFRFNKQTDVERLLPFTPKVEQDGQGHLRISIPPMEAKAIRHAPNTTHIEIKAIAVGVNLQEGYTEPAVSDKVFFDFRQPTGAMELVLPFTAGPEETMVILQVRAFSEMGGKIYALDNLKFFAADIIDIIPSLPEVTENTVHHEQPKKQGLFQLHGNKTSEVSQRE